ncbi:MerR family transcriptional regulator [uncultured Massilia sp.]|uniref:MerR family transcriptional regulator n=1 Tax=uncultured Massilia sp. TaxID=169973 RepID=UPI002588C401|nr:MerR family transcriptional regulator [uncultured Massilia sp.]
MDSEDKEVRNRVMYRSGTAARLAGLPVETLRVWERRYRLSEVQRSEHGQRLYSVEHVERLAMLKQLVDQGHAIGLLAELRREELKAMLGGRDPSRAQASIRALVVGGSLPRRLAALGDEASGIRMLGHCAHLEELHDLAQDSVADVLIVEQSELDEGIAARIAEVRARLGIHAVLVLYRFSANATIRALRIQGCLVARVPADIGELAFLCRSAVRGMRLPEQAAPATTPRRYDDDTLAALAQINQGPACECPRHLAEVLMTVGSFERYSAQCGSRNPEDAELHARLGRAAAQARAVLEEAMAQLILAENLALPQTLLTRS